MALSSTSADSPAAEQANITGVAVGGSPAPAAAAPGPVEQAQQLAQEQAAGPADSSTPAQPGASGGDSTKPAAGGGQSINGVPTDTPVLGGLMQLGQAYAKGQDKIAAQAPFASERLNPFNPIDWGKSFIDQDLYTPYQTARQLGAAFEAFTTPDATSAAVRNIWDQNDAARKRGDFAILPDNDAARWGSENILPEALYIGSHWMPGAGVAGTGGRALDLGLSLAPYAVANLPKDPQSITAALAALGPPTMQAQLNGKEDPGWQANILWGLMTAGAVAGTVLPGHAAMLSKFFPKGGPQMADTLDQWLTKWRDTLTRSQDFSRGAKGIDDALLTPPNEGDITVAHAKAEPKPGAGERLQFERDAEGNLQDVTRLEEQKRVGAVYKKLGITTQQELYGRTWSGAQADIIRQNWQTLKMPYDLIHYGGPDFLLKDPRVQLQHLEGDALGAANEHMAHLHSYIDTIGRGPFWTHDIVNSLARSFLGIHRTLDATHQNYMTSAIRLISQGRTPEQVADSSQRIRKAIEGATEDVPADVPSEAGAGIPGAGQERSTPGSTPGNPPQPTRRYVYDALEPHEKLVADSFRLVTAQLRTEAKRAGLRDSFVGNFFPHLPSKVAEKGSEAAGKTAADAARAAGTHPLLTLERMQHRAAAISPGEFPTGQTAKVFGQETPETTTQLFQHQKYANVEEANQGIRAQRATTLEKMLSGDPKNFATLDRDLQSNTQVRYIRSLLGSDPAKAQKEAQGFLKGYLPLMETDFFRAADQFLPKQAHAVHSQGLMNLLTNPGALMRVAHPVTGQEQVRQMAYRVATPGGPGGASRVVNSRGAQEATRLGYRAVQSPYLRDYVVHPQMADFLDRAAQAGALRGPLNSALYKTGRQMVQNIVALPPFHMMNVAGRVGMLAAMHPIEFTKFVTQHDLGRYALEHPLQFGKSFKTGARPWDEDMHAWALRNEAWRAGVIPHTRGSMFGSELMRAMGNATGEGELDLPHLTSLDDAPDKVRRAGLDGLVKVGQAARTGYDHIQNHFWGNINDFGVLAYHLEKKAALHAVGVDETAHAADQASLPGLLEAAKGAKGPARTAALADAATVQSRIGDNEEKIANAKLWAARRGNSWMGHVAPEDWNSQIHEAARLLMFAPNWWRTFAELLVPAYRRSGVDWTPQMLRHVATTELKTVYAMLATQKLTGNAMNYMLAGHSQADNLPGNQDRLEVTNPWAVSLFQKLGLAPASHTNAQGQVDPGDVMNAAGGIRNTGARLTIENPVARQTRDLEMALGLQSGQPGSQVPVPVPLPGFTNAKGNANVPTPDFGAITNGIARVGAARLSPLVQAMAGMANLDLYRSAHDNQWRHVNPNMGIAGNLEGALMAPLFGMPGGEQLIYAIQRGQQDVPQGTPWATATSKGMQDTWGNAPGVAARALVAMLTGVNPPFDYAPKTEGQAPADDEYVKLKAIQDDYKQESLQKSVEALSGAMSPSDWRVWYHDASQRHAAKVQTIFQGAPAYADGTFAQVNDYEKLYDKATVNGTLNLDLLDKEQADWKTAHTPQEYEQVQSEIRKNEQAFPMLKLYHQTVRDFRDWQSQWAVQNGVDAAAVQSAARQYSGAYGDAKAQQKLLSADPFLRRYEIAKTTQFERSPAGLMYGLFYDSPAVVRYVQTHRLNPQQLETEQLAAANAQGAQGGSAG